MISVCMATYNGEKYIREQIDSILEQLGEEDELIISDDGSTDNTIEIVRSYNDDRIKIFLFNGHCYTKNFENALNHAKGDYIFLSDQDDIWMPDKVSICINELKQYDLVITDARVVDELKNILLNSYFDFCKVRNGFFYNLFFTRYIGACMAFKKEILKSVLPIPDNNKYIAHDYWIACVCEKIYHVKLINIPLLLYRRHSNNTSTGVFGNSKLSLLEKIVKRFYALKYLLKIKKE